MHAFAEDWHHNLHRHFRNSTAGYKRPLTVCEAGRRPTFAVNSRFGGADVDRLQDAWIGQDRGERGDKMSIRNCVLDARSTGMCICF